MANGIMPARRPEAWFLGIDLGTGSCKTVVVDQDLGVLGFGFGDYPAQDTRSRWQEQQPQALLEGMIGSVQAALRQAGPLPGRCAGLSLGGALHSLLALDRHGEPLNLVMTWADGRAIDQALAIRNSAVGRHIYRQTGCPPHGMYPLYKLIWLRQEQPAIFQQAVRFVSAKEYVFYRLTGQFWVDYSLAAGSGLLNTHSLTWDESALSLAAITPDRLSALSPPHQTHKGIKPELAAMMGIPADTPITLGSSDAVNSSIGAGTVHSWQATCMIGTSGAFRIFASQPLLDANARTWCYAIDKHRWLAGGAINNGGLALAWLRDLFNQAIAQVGVDRQLSFEEILGLAESAPAGSRGLICLPLFVGERSPNWNSEARAAFIGLSLEHQAGHIARAILEGVAFRMRSLHEVLVDCGADVRQIRASGGFTRSSLWLQIMASVLNRELFVPTWGETSSLGAACWAMISAGLFVKLEEAAQFIKLDDAYLPIPAESDRYHELYVLYQQFYNALEGLHMPLAEIRAKGPIETANRR